MSLDVNFGDTFPAANHISLTITTDQGMPSSTVSIGDKELETNIRLIDDTKNKYKIRFFLPDDAAGDLKIVVKAGSESVEESKPILAKEKAA